MGFLDKETSRVKKRNAKKIRHFRQGPTFYEGSRHSSPISMDLVHFVVAETLNGDWIVNHT